EARLYSPELRGSLALHWLAVDRSVLAFDSAWTERGRAVPADQLTARLAGAELPLPDGRVALPAHPWQIRELRHRPEAAELLDAGLLQDLGPHGTPWHPTSSVRTLYRTGAAAMLKLSLGLRITNSRRENLRKELHRGVEVHRLLRSGLAERWQSAHPCFDVVRDPAWLAVNDRDG
ncbi:IucA/IucC family protein, partial [Streptomyces alboniger]